MRYRLLEKTDSLFQGDIFRAEWTGVEGFVKFVSVCNVRQELCRNAAAIDMLLEDLSRASKKPGSGTARVLDVWRDSTRFAVCTEFEGGTTLFQLLENEDRTGKTFPVEAVLSLGLDAARALETLHDFHVSAEPVCHGDLRPENIILSHGGAVKIRSVGFGRFLPRADKSGSWYLWNGRCYQPVERQLGGEPAQVDDVFSLGAVLYELFAGRSLFELTEKAATGTVRAVPVTGLFDGDLPERLGGHSEDVVRMLERACHPERENRYSTISELAEEIHRCLWQRKYADSSPSLNLRLMDGEGGKHQQEDVVTGSGTEETVVLTAEKPAVVWTVFDYSQPDPETGVVTLPARLESMSKSEQERTGRRVDVKAGRERKSGSNTGAFVGRRELVEKAANCFEALQHGGGAFLVTGEMGMGRSRFISEVRERLVDGSGNESAWIHVSLRPEERKVACSGLLRFLAGFMGLDPMAELWEVGRDVQRLRAFALDEKTIAAVRGASGVARLERDPVHVERLLSSAVIHCWKLLSDEQIAVLACDDVHFLDYASVPCLNLMLDELSSVRGFVLMTAVAYPDFLRNEKWEWLHVSELAPFTRKECERFLLNRIESAESIDSSLLNSLWKASRGSPLVLREYIDLLFETGGILVLEGRVSFSGGEEQSLPRLVTLVQEYMKKLPRKESSLVLMSALAGPALDPAVLARLSGENEPEIVKILDSLSIQRRVIEKKGMRYVFRNENMRAMVVKAARRGLAKKLVLRLSDIIFDEWEDPPRGAVEHVSGLLEEFGEDKRAAETLIESAGRRRSRGDYRGAARSYKKAAKLTNYYEDKDESGRLRLFLEAGRACLSDLDLGFAEEVLERAGHLAQKSGKELQGAEANILSAKVFARSGRVNEALDLARTVVPLAEKSGDEMLMAKVYASIAESYQQWGTYGPDGSFVSRAVRIAEKHGDMVKLGEYLQLAVMHAMGVGDYEKTREYLDRVRPIAEMGRDPGLKARLFCFEGLLCLMTRKLDEGVDVSREGAKFARKHGLLESEIAALHNAGVCHYEKGDIQEAMYHFNESYRKAAEAEFHKMIAANEIYIGHIEAVYLGNESGLQKIRSAIRSEFRVGRLWNIPQGLQLRGRTESALGKQQDALKSFLKALDVAKETGVKYFVENAEKSLREFQANPA